MNTEELKAIAEWFVSRDTGISSETMAAIHLGAEKGQFNPPLDPFQVNDCRPAFAQKGMDFNSWLNLRSYLRMQIAVDCLLWRIIFGGLFNYWRRRYEFFPVIFKTGTNI